MTPRIGRTPGRDPEELMGFLREFHEDAAAIIS
jgi:hypothetical protein